MKPVILSADGDSVLYSVPDIAADHLEDLCLDFCTDWLWNSPDAEKYRKHINGVLCVSYDEADFIDYLNTYKFPETRSVLVKSLGWTRLGKDLPEEYRTLPYFNF